LPSLCAGFAGASEIWISDYPVKSILENIEANIRRNVELSQRDKFHVVGYKWGEDIMQLIPPSAASPSYFDVALAAECLWRHESHLILCQSVVQCLKLNGHLILTFSHHIPGMESDDLHFFEVAESLGLVKVHSQEFSVDSQWSDRKKSLFLCVLEKIEINC
jgi:EEF1A N-terminal glycine/lysine methyltransferase